MITQTIDINGIQYQVKIHFEKRKNSSVSIRRTNINIRIPYFLSQKEKTQRIQSMKYWAKKKILNNPECFKPETQKEYNDGEKILVGDEEYNLRIEFKEKKNISAKLQGQTIHLSISNHLTKKQQNKHISSLISRCIAKKRLPILQRKIEELNKQHFNQKIGKIYFKYNKSNWGSCSHANNINISTRLLFAPDDVLEYVCIHELAHLLEHNHSERYWTLVEKVMPDYKTKEQWLKEKKDICRF
ncbi:MAG: M48 family metallopeptidase [Candidatus Thermoplasmatota archaeon]|nr:M48 family metallopeptidase [Candidatus Thermoplasmatota archaeon]